MGTSCLSPRCPLSVPALSPRCYCPRAASGVCGGEPCIVRTRLPVWALEQSRRLGMSEDELLWPYPALRAEDLVNAWAYVRSHRAEIEDQIRANESP